MVVVTGYVWLRPVHATTRSLLPFSCGSPAAPVGGDLAEFACGGSLTAARLTILALLAATALVILISEVVWPRLAGRAWSVGSAVVLPPAVTILALSTTGFFRVVSRRAADGNVIRCGTPLQPASDPIAVQLCADLVGTARTDAIGGVILAAALLLGASYVTHRRRTVAAEPDQESDDVP
ncbi:MAG: hypothetical protein Q4G67_00070 [Actinomycetia bacterium]|nr:hypothetical protein [Actinomycetes bacterium]